MKRYNAMFEDFNEITVLGKPALFTCVMLDDCSIPKGLYRYDVRGDEYSGEPIELAPRITNGHYGTIIMAEEVDMDESGRCRLDHYQDWIDEPYSGRASCVGRIEYLAPNGIAYGSCEYDDAEQFRHDVLNDLYYGIPLVLVLYKDARGKTMFPSLGWVGDEGFLPKGIRYEQYRKEACCKVKDFVKRYRPDLLPHMKNRNKGGTYADRVH